jgi:hypothetical protein
MSTVKIRGPCSALTCTPWWVKKGWLYINVLREDVSYLKGLFVVCGVFCAELARLVDLQTRGVRNYKYFGAFCTSTFVGHCNVIFIELARTIYIYGVYTVCLAGNLPDIRSYTVHTYGSGQP